VYVCVCVRVCVITQRLPWGKKTKTLPDTLPTNSLFAKADSRLKGLLVSLRKAKFKGLFLKMSGHITVTRGDVQITSVFSFKAKILQSSPWQDCLWLHGVRLLTCTVTWCKALVRTKSCPCLHLRSDLNAFDRSRCSQGKKMSLKVLVTPEVGTAVRCEESPLPSRKIS